MQPSPFTHAVASFDPTQTAVLLWTRAVGVTEVEWFVVADDHSRQVLRSGRAAVPAETDGCVAVDVDGLEPACRYRYWFEAMGHRSPVGRTRTLPGPGTTHVRLAVVLCRADHSVGDLVGYRSIAETDVDLVLHLGDYIYEAEGSGSDRPMDPPGVVTDLAGYRGRYADIRRDADLQALHLAHPVVAIWDDHDLADNVWRGGAKAHDPDRHGPWDHRVLAAALARQEWLPARLRDPNDVVTLWRSCELGDLARLVITDSRLVGRDAPADQPGAKPLDDPERSLLGEAQRRWLRDEVARGREPWCLLATQVVCNALTLPVPVGAEVNDRTPSGYAVIDGEALCTDEWDGYPAERRRLVEMIDERSEGQVVLLSGDVHSSWAFEGPAAASGAPVAVELTASGITSVPAGQQLPGPLHRLVSRLLEDVADAATASRWADIEHNGYLVVDITPAAVTGHWFAVDPHDRSVLTHLAGLAVRAGERGRLVEVDEAPPFPRTRDVGEA